nr:MAG TPA: hypothetical protein [Caudoviricetes sp.]
MVNINEVSYGIPLISVAFSFDPSYYFYKCIL